MSKTYSVAALLLLLALVFSGCIGPAVEHDEDIEPPEISLISPENDTFIAPGDDIQISVVDGNLSRVSYSVNSESYLEFRHPYRIDTSDWTDGNYTISVRAEDSEGNIAEAMFFFIIDTKPPSIYLLFPHNGSAMESNGEIRLSIEDSNLLGAGWRLDGGGPRILPYPYTIDVAWWSEGEHSITVYADDMAGNRAQRSYSFVIDNMPAGIVVASPSSRVIRPGTDIVFEIDEDNIVDINCTVNGQEVDFSSRILDTADWKDGEYYIVVNATDLAGHSTLVSYVFEVDSIPPSIALSHGDGSELLMDMVYDLRNLSYTHAGQALEVYPEDPHLMATYFSINSAEYSLLKSPYQIDLYGIRGRQANISVKAVDLAGNIAYRNISIFLKYNLTIRMGQGYSEIGIPLVLNNTYIRDVFSTVNGTYSKVSTYVNGSWKTFNPAYPDKFNLDLLYVETYMGFVVSMDGPGNLSVNGYLPYTYTIHLRKGSNMVPYLSARPVRLDIAFADVPWYRVQRWDWQSGEYVDVRGNELLIPGQTYWVYTSEDSFLIFDF